MKRLFTILCLLGVCLYAFSQTPLTPISYNGYNADGSPQTNKVIFTPYPPNQPFYSVGTNVVTGLSPFAILPSLQTNSGSVSGFFSNNIVPITYAVTISNSPNPVAFFVTIPFTPTYTPLSACMTQSPIVTFFSSTYSLVTNWLGFCPPSSNQSGILNALGYTPPTNNYNGISNSLGFGPATNTQIGLIATLLYTPATNSFMGISNALGYNPTNLQTGQVITNAYLYGATVLSNGLLNLYSATYDATNVFGPNGYTNTVGGVVIAKQDNLGNTFYAGITTAGSGFASKATNFFAAFSSSGWTNTNGFSVTVDFPNGVTNVYFSNSVYAVTGLMTNVGAYSRHMGINWIVTNATANMSWAAE